MKDGGATVGIEDFFKVDFWEMILRTTLTFLALLFFARIMGKKQISQLTFFHYVTGITIGSIAAEMAAQTETLFMNGMVAMGWWALLTIIMSYIAMKSNKLRVLIDDKPTIVIQKGKIEEQALKKARLHINDLNMMLREQGVFSIQDVYYAIFETNGNLSVLKKPSKEPATKSDVQADTSIPKFVPTEVISDGKLLLENLIELGLTEEWVEKELEKKGIGHVNQVFYAEVQQNGSLHVDIKKEWHS